MPESDARSVGGGLMQENDAAEVCVCVCVDIIITKTFAERSSSG